MFHVEVGDKFIIEGGGKYLNSLYRRYVGKTIEITNVCNYQYGSDRDVRWNVEGTRDGQPGFDDGIPMSNFHKFAMDVGLRKLDIQASWEV